MKTFKEYLQKVKTPVLSWESGHKEVRDLNKKDEKILSWESGHKEVRDLNKKLSEEITVVTHENDWHKKDTHIEQYKNNNKSAIYDSSIHDDPDIKPKKLTNTTSIKNYASESSESSAGHGSSKNINNYLRNRMGDKTVGIYNSMHKPEAVEKSIKKLSSNFTPKNTNRKEITTYSGVPKHIGEKLESCTAGAEHHLAGFTSTSTSRAIGAEFAHSCAMDHKFTNIHHIIRFKVLPGTGLSVVHHSPYNENEVLLHHGLKTIYDHTEVNHGTRFGKPIETHIHHVTAHPEHKDLSEYGSYDHPIRN